jgi:hypothetical protein
VGPGYPRTGTLREAFALSLHNALILGRSEATRRMYGCLYGLESSARGPSQPVIPWGVSILATLQSFFSFVLIFLFGLGLRNMFRIR